MKKQIPSEEELKKYSHKKMTLPLMEHASDDVKEAVWKLVKRLSTYARTPGTVADYKKMAVFAENDAIVDVVLDTLKDMKYPFKNTDFIPDVSGYYYSIALISQSMHRRDETIKLFNELVDYAIDIKSDSALPLARNMDVLSKEYPDLADLFEKARIIYKIDAIDSIKTWVPIKINRIYRGYISADRVEAEYINVENPQDGKVFVEVDEKEYVVRVVEKGKDIFTKKFKHYSYDMIVYAVVRDVLLKKHMEEMQIDDMTDAGVVEAMRNDLKQLYSENEISANNKEFDYIMDGHETYNNTGLPQDVRDYLEEIYNDPDLKDAFYFDCDIEIYDEAGVKDMEEDTSWFDDMMGPGECSYKNIKPFAHDGVGGLWAVLDDEKIGYIGTEGECGIIARNINEFMNILAVYRGYIDDLCGVDILKSEEAFLKVFKEERDSDYSKEFNGFIRKHHFTKNPKRIYEYLIKGVTMKPFFQVTATDDEYVDSRSILRGCDGQEILESLIKL
ncbi:MAG: SMI1/KNR4 family protein [Ruminococcus albus]|nr:SMI1/KNR4 family protein [Ruminococcus albus]